MKLVVGPLKGQDAIGVAVCDLLVASLKNSDACSLMQELVGDAGTVTPSVCCLVMLVTAAW